MNEDIKELIEPYLNAKAECDGMTRIIHSILSMNNVPHDVMIGYLTFRDISIYHFWIVWEGLIVDYRSKMWFPDAPQGIFNPQEYPEVRYDGVASNIPTLSIEMINLLFFWE